MDGAVAARSHRPGAGDGRPRDLARRASAVGVGRLPRAQRLQVRQPRARPRGPDSHRRGARLGDGDGRRSAPRRRHGARLLGRGRRPSCLPRARARDDGAPGQPHACGALGALSRAVRAVDAPDGVLSRVRALQDRGDRTADLRAVPERAVDRCAVRAARRGGAVARGDGRARGGRGAPSIGATDCAPSSRSELSAPASRGTPAPVRASAPHPPRAARARAWGSAPRGCRGCRGRSAPRWTEGSTGRGRPRG